MPTEREPGRPEPNEEDQRVAESRRLVEECFANLRGAAHEDLGIAPKSRSWVLPVVGLAVGFGLAVRAFRRRRWLKS
ncbi:MAG TPA: hypothetical protein VGS57_22625 [Thermoanaerobaculia bacterium]|jgi:hypothetical protein|nr:hypothetical protein [Thermoanaerobaculia bacterium]